MGTLQDKYKGWAVVRSGTFSYLGLVVAGDLEIGGAVTLRPCFDLKHRVHIQDRGNQMPVAGMVPVISPPDLCLTADVAMHMRIDSFFAIENTPEDNIAMYDDIVTSVVAQFEAKRKAIRSARSGLVAPPAGFDPSKFKGP